ncbi:MAG TPA: hypothetical protein VFI14_01575 [Chryseosolibacter sp.]|nr:hypothetical protein [Chryseosolibacter sp.]
MTIRKQFAKQFGEDQAAAIEAAAKSHGNGINDVKIGEPFKWALLICIGYQCFEIDRYRRHHNITAPFSEIKEWIINHADLASYRGDLDYLSLMAGTYNEYMKEGSDVAAS